MADVLIRFKTEGIESVQKAISNVQNAVSNIDQNAAQATNFFSNIENALRDINSTIRTTSDANREAIASLSEQFGELGTSIESAINNSADISSALGNIETTANNTATATQSLTSALDGLQNTGATSRIAEDIETLNRIMNDIRDLTQSSVQQLGEGATSVNLGELNQLTQKYRDLEDVLTRLGGSREAAREAVQEINVAVDQGLSINEAYDNILNRIGRTEQEVFAARQRIIEQGAQATQQAQNHADALNNAQQQATQTEAQGIRVRQESARATQEAIRSEQERVDNFKKNTQTIRGYLADLNNIVINAQRGIRVYQVFTLGLSKKFTAFQRILNISKGVIGALQFLFTSISQGLTLINNFTSALRKNDKSILDWIDVINHALAIMRFFVGLLENVPRQFEALSRSFDRSSRVGRKLSDTFLIAGEGLKSFIGISRSVLNIADKNAGRLIKLSDAFNRFRAARDSLNPNNNRLGGIGGGAPSEDDIQKATDAYNAYDDILGEVNEKQYDFEKATKQSSRSVNDSSSILAKAINAYESLGGVGANTIRSLVGIEKEADNVNRQAGILLRTWTRLSVAVAASIYTFDQITNSTNSLIGGIVNTTQNFQTMRATLRVTERDIAGVSDQLIELNRVVTGIKIDTLLVGFTQLRVAGQSISQAQTNLEAIAKATSELGKSSEVTARVITQLTQAFASNIAEGGDLKIIFREIPQISQAATTALGRQISGWKDLANVVRENQNLDLRTALNQTLTELNRIAVGGDINTFAVQLERFRENITEVQRAIGGRLVPALTRGLNAVNAWITEGGLERLYEQLVSITKVVAPLGIAIFTVFQVQRARIILRIGRLITNFGIDVSHTFSRLRTSTSAFFSSLNQPFPELTRRFNTFSKNTLSVAGNALKRVGSAFSGLVRQIGPTIGAIAAITAAIQLWIEISETNRKALELEERAILGYRSSLLGAADAIQDLSNERNFKGLNQIHQRLIDEIKEYQDEIKATENRLRIIIHTELPGSANLRRRQAAQQGIEQNERLIELLRQVREEEGTIEARINAVLQLRLEFEKAIEQQTIRVLKAEEEYAEKAKASNEANLQAEKQQLQLSRNQLKTLDAQLKALEAQQKVRGNIIEESVLPIELSQQRNNIKDLQEELNNLRKGNNIQAIQDTTAALVRAYGEDIQIQSRHARTTIDNADKLNDSLYNIFQDRIRLIDKATDESDKRLEEIRLDNLPDISRRFVNPTEFRDAISKIDELTQHIGRGSIILNTLRKAGENVFRTITNESRKFSLDFQNNFNTIKRTLENFYTQLQASQSITRQVRESLPLLFPDLSDQIQKLSRDYATLNKRQRELLPALARYKGQAIDTINAIRDPFQNLLNTFRQSDLSEVLTPGVNERGNEIILKNEEKLNERRKNLLEKFNKESEKANNESLQRTLNSYQNAFNSIEQAITSIDLSQSAIENVKRIVTAFVSSSLRIIVQSKIEFEIRKKYSNELATIRIANEKKVYAAITANQIAQATRNATTGIGNVASNVANFATDNSGAISTALGFLTSFDPLASLLSAPLQLVINNVIGNKTVETQEQEARFNKLEGL